jgi:hypothetical protein
MRTTLTRALGDDSPSSSSTTTAQDSQSTQDAQRNGNGNAVDCPEGSGGQSDGGQSNE